MAKIYEIFTKKLNTKILKDNDSELYVMLFLQNVGIFKSTKCHHLFGQYKNHNSNISIFPHLGLS